MDETFSVGAEHALLRRPSMKRRSCQNLLRGAHSMSMAVRKHASLLLLVILIAPTYFSGAAAFDAAHSGGLHGRKILFQSTESIEQRPSSACYMTTLAALQVRKNTSHATGVDIHTDYNPTESHPPHDYHDYPSPATMNLHKWNQHEEGEYP